MIPRPTLVTLLLPGLLVTCWPLLDARAADPLNETAVMLRAWKEGQRFRSVRTSGGFRQPGVRSLAFAPTGRLLASGGDRLVCVWDTRDWSLLSRFAVEADVSWLRFSPDRRWLYVAGVPEKGLGLLARFDWQQSKLDRAYSHGPATFRCRMDLSPDGRRLGLALAPEARFLVIDTQSGALLHSGDCSRDRPAVSLGPDARTFLRTRDLLGGPAGEKDIGATPTWSLINLGKERAEERDLSGKVFWQFSPTGRHLLSGMAAESDRDGLTLRIHDPTGLEVLARRHDLRFGSWQAFSGDGGKLVVASQDREPDDELCQTLRGGVRFTTLSVPDLDLLRRWEVLGESGLRLSGLALSPDGGILGAAVRDHRGGPCLFDTSTGRRILPGPGHTSRIVSVHFLPDGQTLRSIDSDGVVCRWDLPSMRLKDRLAIPPHCAVLAARPSDGKYLICRLPSTHRRLQTLGVVDADTGCLVCSLPGSWWIDQPLVLWLSDVQAFLVERRRVIRIDCRKGEIIEERRLDREGPRRDLARSDWQPDQMLLNWVNGDTERGLYEGCRLDVETGLLAAEDLELPQKSFRHYGAVPGGRWFYAADPDLFLIDRETMKVKTKPALGKARIETLAFTADGSCLALACAEPEFLGDSSQRAAPWPRRLLRIHDTLSGRILAALPGAESIVQMRFSPDGRRLAVVHDDDTIEAWDLPGLVRR